VGYDSIISASIHASSECLFQAERIALIGMNYFLLSVLPSVGRNQSGTDCARIASLLLALLLSIWSGFGQHFQQGRASQGERWVRVPPFAPLILGCMTVKTSWFVIFPACP